MTNGYNTVQQKMLRLLSDGMRHTAKELYNCLYDEEGAASNIHIHLNRIRRKLKERGETIVFVRVNKVSYYQHVKLPISVE
jgi:DNA-binding response OmpR family regulator